jgi:hypothetical protein
MASETRIPSFFNRQQREIRHSADPFGMTGSDCEDDNALRLRVASVIPVDRLPSQAGRTGTLVPVALGYRLSFGPAVGNTSNP